MRYRVIGSSHATEHREATPDEIEADREKIAEICNAQEASPGWFDVFGGVVFVGDIAYQVAPE